MVATSKVTWFWGNFLTAFRLGNDTNGEYCGVSWRCYGWGVAANSQTVPVAPANAGSALSIILSNGRNEAAKVWTLCWERLRPTLNGVRNLAIGSLARVASRQDLSGESARASATPSVKFSKRPHNKIGFSFAWVCECGSFSALRSASQSHEGEVERQCPACGEAQRLAYVRLLCEPRNDTDAAPGKWVYPEVAMESDEKGGLGERDYDWSYYDVIYFQGDREPDVSTCALALRS